MKNIFIGIGVFVMMLTLSACDKTQDTSEKKDNNTTTEQVAKKEEKGMVKKMAEKMAGGQKCVIKENGKVISTMYMDGDRMRADGDASLMGEGKTGEMASTLSDGEWMYMWSHAEKQGMKVKIEEDETYEDDVDIEEDVEEYDESTIQEMIEEKEDMNLDYSCEKWKVDEKMFIPPADVEFVDMAVMMKGVADEMMGTK
ncbi:MAG: hypothetical protein CR972_04405 [Candidatus Moraniibacteriota bacterium]|nr:MAG: hypothetical protein CR972_04405 [Candidatus Moranbacteria bacterium]